MRHYSFYIGFILASTFGLQAQNVNDSVSYTPIPLPVGEKAFKEKPGMDSINGSEKPVYFFSLNVGSLFGCGDCVEAAGVSSTFSAVNGVAIKKLRAGIGLGFDSYYGWNVIPLTGMLSLDLWGTRNTNALFLQLNYGQSKVWAVDAFERYGFERAKGGRMIAPLVGYRIKYHDVNITILAGVKWQRVTSHYSYPSWNWINGEWQQGTNTTQVEENMSRLMISLSVGLR
jgi:hypothetical protein